MKFLIFLTSLTLLTLGCGSTTPIIDPKLGDMVLQLERDLGITVDYDVRVGDLGQTSIGHDIYGRCSYYTFPRFKPRFVTIDIDNIEKGNTSVLLVLLHEIGHCSYRYGHPENKKIRYDGCQKLVMGVGYKRKYCEKYYDEYIYQIKFDNPIHPRL